MKKVLCPGEAIIDFVAQDKNANLKKSIEFIKKAGGAPVNAAGAIAKFDVEPFFIGTVGDDPFGLFLEEEMIKYNINTKYLKKNKLIPTTLAFVSLNEEGERDFKFNRGADEKLYIDKIDDFKQFDCFHFASATAFLGGDLEESYYSLLNYARENNILITFDANYRDSLFGDKKEMFISKSKEFIKKSDIVKLSEEEALLIGQSDDFNIACKNIKKLGCKILIITLGKDGSKVYIDDELYFVSTTSVKMVDATGAGDAFIGSLIAQIVKSESLEKEDILKFVEISSKIGALTTTKYGALESIPSMDQL